MLPEVRTHGQTVFASEAETQVEDVGTAAVGQAVPIEMRRAETGRQDRLDLGPELELKLLQPGAGEELRNPLVAIEVAGLIDQGRHAISGGARSPAIGAEVVDQRQVRAEGLLRAIREGLHRVRRPGAWRHQGGRSDEAVLKGTDDSFIDGVADAE